MNEKYSQDFIKAGALAREVRLFGKSLIKKDGSYNEVINKINEKIAELGAIPAFPPQIALNNVAAHFLPEPGEEIIFSDEVVKLDIGVCYNGAIGDCAVTIDLSGKFQKLVEAAEAALAAAEENIKVGVTFGEIGRIIEERISSYGFSPIKNLSGHGLGYYKIHTAPCVPNYNDRSTAAVKRGMTFAIEPFATDGKGFIYEVGQAAIFSHTKKRAKFPLSTVEAFLLEKIKSFNGLPFAIHSFMGESFSLSEVKKGFYELLREGVIVGYAPLVEESKKMVAQAENSVLVDKQGKVFITTR